VAVKKTLALWLVYILSTKEVPIFNPGLQNLSQLGAIATSDTLYIPPFRLCDGSNIFSIDMGNYIRMSDEGNI